MQSTTRRWNCRCLALPRRRVQIANAAAAIAALHALRESLGWNPEAVVRGVRDARLPGRMQTIAVSPQVVVDVAHNPQAARELARWLDFHRIPGETFAVFGALRDKDVAGIVRALHPRIAHWHVAGLEADSPRGLPAGELARRVREAIPEAALDEHADVAAAMQAARAGAAAQDRILVFGSFFVVAAALPTDAAAA